MTQAWLERLLRDEILLIDGGMGTEIERRGVAMDAATWCGASMLSHPEIIRSIHEDYIRAGARVITTNTFGTARQMLEGADLGDRVAEINRKAVEVARQARNNIGDGDVAIAGSISAMPPHFDRDTYPSRQRQLDIYREQAGILAEAGVDLLTLEMMEEPDHSPLAIRAAFETGLPVWIGTSCKRHPEHGGIVSFDHPHLAFEELVPQLLDQEPAAVNIMHSEIDAIGEAIEIVRRFWQGPLGVYPESGHFEKPSWKFVEVIAPSDLVEEAKRWAASGVRILGGCCGTSPEHVRALNEALPVLATEGA